MKLETEVEHWDRECPKCKLHTIYWVPTGTHHGNAVMCWNQECEIYWVHKYRELEHAEWVCKEMH